MPSTKAPRGGIVIGGHYFKGGTWIPGAVADRSAMLTSLAAHKANADPKHTALIKRLHEVLGKRYGADTDKRIGVEAKATKEAHDKAKDEGHKKHLSMRLGSLHAAMDDGKEKPKGDAEPEKDSGAAPTSIHAPSDVSKKGASITIMKQGSGYMAYVGKPGEEESAGATAEEAIGKLVLENAEKFGITIQRDGDGK